jgi:peptide/nickel transport system permease protein
MMLQLVLRRIGVTLVTLWVVSVILFAATELLPGDVAEIMLGQEATPQSVKALRKALGIDKPAPVRYVDWLVRMATLDLGTSLAGRAIPTGGTPIGEMIRGRLANTLMLSWLVAGFAVPVSLVLGLLAAMFPMSLFDRTVSFVTLCLVSIPEFFTATLLVLVFAIKLRWIPAIVIVNDDANLWQTVCALALPIITLCLVMLAQMARMTRAAILNVMASPYIEMAILKGVPRSRIVWRHALSNAIGPIVNIVALNIAFLVTGVVIVETIFAYPGLGRLMVNAVQVRDMPLVQACGMLFCTIYLVVILFSDIVSVVSNPRLRHPKH